MDVVELIFDYWFTIRYNISDIQTAGLACMVLSNKCIECLVNLKLKCVQKCMTRVK